MQKRFGFCSMNTGFQSVFHPSVTLTWDTGVVLTYGKKEKKLEAGESLTIEQGSKYLKDGCMTIVPETDQGRILVSSISRSQGVPSYRGAIEIREEPEGLTIVNDLYLEDYLKTVVPSEMPATTGGVKGSGSLRQETPHTGRF